MLTADRALPDGGPDVSVIVPVHNGEAFLAEALASVLAQDYPRFEVIVVDDGSSDASAAIALAHPGVRFLRQDQRGPAAARNAGVAASQGRYLAFVDADDLIPPHKLSRQVGYLQRHSDVGCVFAHEELLFEPGAPLPWWARPGGLRSSRLGDGEPINAMSMVVRAETFRCVGEFDESFRTGEDLDWVLRLQELGIGMHVLEDVLLVRRIHRDSLTQSQHEPNGTMLRVLHARAARRRRGENDRR